MKFQRGDVWISHFPLEEDPSKYTERPAIIVVSAEPEVVIVKVTRTAPRKNDRFDVPINYFKEAGLKHPSTARVSKIVAVDDYLFYVSFEYSNTSSLFVHPKCSQYLLPNVLAS